MRTPDYNRIQKAAYHLKAIKMILNNIKPENRTRLENLRIDQTIWHVEQATKKIVFLANEYLSSNQSSDK